MMALTGIHMPTTLTFVASEEHYSTYRAEDGTEVYLAHGTGQPLVDFEDLDLESLWQEFLRDNRYAWCTDDFRELLRSLTTDPEEVDHVAFCADCSAPDHEDDQHSVSGGAVCERCVEDYWWCNDCEERYRSTTTTLDDTEACSSCLENNWSFCEECDGYYRDDNSGDHDHGNCSCEAPGQSFFVRNDGEPPLANDTRVTVTLPAGVISNEGIQEIRNLLRQHSYTLVDDDERSKMRQLAYGLDELGDMWQTKRGNYTKRLSRLAYEKYSLKLPPAVVSQVGCIARDHSTAVDFQIETTRNLNLPPEEFAHEDSCWWGSYSASRCTLKSNGGFGLRTFNDSGWGSGVSGRAWVMPLKMSDGGNLMPTFETEAPDAFMVFNGYGVLSGYTAARIVSHMAGMTYRKIGFRCEPMYVNNDSGYLVAPEVIATGYTDGSLSLAVEVHSNLFNRESQRKVLVHA